MKMQRRRVRLETWQVEKAHVFRCVFFSRSACCLKEESGTSVLNKHIVWCRRKTCRSSMPHVTKASKCHIDKYVGRFESKILGTEDNYEKSNRMDVDKKLNRVTGNRVNLLIMCFQLFLPFFPVGPDVLHTLNTISYEHTWQTWTCWPDALRCVLIFWGGPNIIRQTVSSYCLLFSLAFSGR